MLLRISRTKSVLRSVGFYASVEMVSSVVVKSFFFFLFFLILVLYLVKQSSYQMYYFALYNMR